MEFTKTPAEDDTDNTTREDPLRGPDLERPDFGPAIFDLVSGNVFKVPVEHSSIQALEHFSVHFDADPTSEEAQLLIQVLDNDGYYQTGFISITDLETYDWDAIDLMLEELVYHDNCDQFTSVFCAETAIEALDDWTVMVGQIMTSGIAVLLDYIGDYDDHTSVGSLY
jgi:hypothetical protein